MRRFFAFTAGANFIGMIPRGGHADGWNIFCALAFATALLMAIGKKD